MEAAQVAPYEIPPAGLQEEQEVEAGRLARDGLLGQKFWRFFL